MEMTPGILLFLAGLYLFLIAPNVRRRKLRFPGLTGWHYAHRGLYNAHVPENSLEAFDRAAAAGYGIEMDVRLTRDGQMVICHDASLLRMTGQDVRISCASLAEVQALPLMGTDQRAPTLDQALEVIGGRVPIILEIKWERPGESALARKVYQRMQQYSGPYCVESFDPLVIRWFKRHAPQVVRGQLAANPALAHQKKFGLAGVISGHLLLNFLSRPDFVAYDHETDQTLSFRVMRALFRPLLVAWTVRSQEAFEKTLERYDLLIFEGFDPPAQADQPKQEKEQPQ